MADAPNTVTLQPRLRLLVAANAAVVVAGFAVAAITARSLPAHYPIHFDVAGRPDRWASGAGLEWYLLPITGAVLCPVLVGVALALPRLPANLLNVPNRAAFMRLAPEARARILRSITELMLLLGLLLGVQFIALQLATFGSAVAGALLPWLLLPILGGITIVATAVGMSIRIARAIRAATTGSDPARADPAGR